MTIQTSNFYRNKAEYYGGVVDCSGLCATLGIANSNFHKNSATIYDGGFIRNLGGISDIYDPAIYSNTVLAGNRGGGANGYGSILNFTNSTLYANSALSGNGGGIANLGAFALLTIRNSTI